MKKYLKILLSAFLVFGAFKINSVEKQNKEIEEASWVLYFKEFNKDKISASFPTDPSIRNAYFEKEKILLSSVDSNKNEYLIRAQTDEVFTSKRECFKKYLENFEKQTKRKIGKDLHKIFIVSHQITPEFLEITYNHKSCGEPISCVGKIRVYISSNKNIYELVAVSEKENPNVSKFFDNFYIEENIS